LQLDTFFPPSTELSEIPALARAAEAIVFSTAWVAETQHNPFLAADLIAEHTKKMKVGTAIAVIFARSPAVMAHTARDIAELSSGRFQLGLGTQVRGHIERRFGLAWPDSPLGKLREKILDIRVFWANWHDGQPLNQRGDYYKITLTSHFFTPQPIKFPQPPIWIACVNRGMERLVGELADGFLVNPFHSERSLKQSILPAIEE
jgi:probable F420-dependent oxidoreductase